MTTTGMTTDAPWSTGGESHDDDSIKGTAGAKAGEVGQAASSQAAQVAGEAKAQAAGLAQQAKEQIGTSVQQQHSKLTETIRSAADELASLVTGENGEAKAGPITDVVRSLATQARASADSLENKTPGELVEQFSAFARRKPGTFLLGAALAGVLAGRLTRGAKEATSSNDDEALSTGYPQPAISSYATETGYPATDETYPGETYAGAGYSTGGDIYEETRSDVLSLPDATGGTLGGTRPIADRGL